MAKKRFSTVGMIAGILLVLAGVLTLSGVLGGDTNMNSGSSYLYDSGYASFGADFYTFVSNNAAEAASAARTTANNLDSIAYLLSNFFGVMLIGFGLFTFCYFGVKRAECKPIAAAPIPAPIPAPFPPVDTPFAAPAPVVEPAAAEPEAPAAE